MRKLVEHPNAKYIIGEPLDHLISRRRYTSFAVEWWTKETKKDPKNASHLTFFELELDLIDKEIFGRKPRDFKVFCIRQYKLRLKNEKELSFIQWYRKNTQDIQEAWEWSK